MEQLERIKNMEEKMNRHQALTDRLMDILDEFDDSLEENYSLLDRYYGSKEYQDDLDAWDEGKIPEDQPCGVLSEDGLWDLFAENQEILARFLELSARLVRRY